MELDLKVMFAHHIMHPNMRTLPAEFNLWQNLSEYCKKDTFSMALLLDVLYKNSKSI